ncbi:hypothetical protein [Rasiella sp. SM2506]|uniref:hypothetical protein n=1 Tax=Rasiella sp. SM2506 TaxID=3423914 RepID=UPI003D79CB13
MAFYTKICLAWLCLSIFIGCDQEQTSTKELSAYVPQDATWVLKVSNMEALQNETSNNKLLSAFEDASLYKILNKKGSLLSYLNLKNESVVSLTKRNDSIWDYTIATRQDSLVFVIDSVANKSVETLEYDGVVVQRITLDGVKGFTAIKDSVFIASTSQQQLQAILKGDSPASINFEKAFKVLKNNELTSIIPKPTFQFSKDEIHILADYSSLDVFLGPNGIRTSGVALAQDTLPKLLSVFKGQIAQQNDLEHMIPNSATKAISITLSDASLLIENLKKYRKDSISVSKLDLFGSASELGEIELPEGNAVVLKSIDSDLTNEALASSLTELEIYRDTPISKFDDGSIFKKMFRPFVQTDTVSLVFQLDNFFVFAENNSVAQTIISAVKNNTYLGKSTAFENAQTQISNASSFLSYGMNDGVGEVINNALKNEAINLIASKNLDDFSLALLQFRFDRDFAHIHFVCEETSGTKSTGVGVSEVFSKTLDNTIMGSPQFFSDHRSGTKNIVIQDITNTLHLLSNNGKTLWTKQLDGAIIGKINEVDLLRNGQKQIAFTTQNKFYVVDRNGKDVGAFPIKFKDKITQPLSVFDYDNNRKYRFIIVQGKEILMYDSKGKVVSGFTFKKTKNTITLPVEHIRIGNKDYIIVAEENGTLNILSRTGKSRISVNKTFNFSENPIEREGSSFVIITKENEKISIDTNGKVSTQKLEVTNNYHFTTSGSTKVTLDDNLLRIDGRLAELPLGIYTNPQVFVANRNVYIVISETQEKKVYLFRKNGTLMNGFPVFGSSGASISEAKNKILLTVIGQDNEVVLFQL